MAQLLVPALTEYDPASSSEGSLDPLGLYAIADSLAVRLSPGVRERPWNPSTLEQRTGRIDRIGAKVERCGRPVHVYLPYVAETQDEKMYREELAFKLGV